MNRSRSNRASDLLKTFFAQNSLRRSSGASMMENLEQRQMLALTGVTLTSLPLEFYNATGQVNFDAATGAFDVVASPTGVFLPSGPKTVVGGHGDFQIHARLNNLGGLVSGVNAGDSVSIGSVDSNGDDFIYRGGIDLDGNGSIDPITETGDLLRGEIYAFGFLDTGTTADQYDYRFVVTGGLLSSYFTGKDIGVVMTSENSTFTDDFGVNFSGRAKGSAGPIATPVLSSIAGNVYYDQNNDGTFQGTEAGIPGTTVTLTGVNDAGQAVSLSQPTGANGEYKFAGLRPGTYTLTETQPSGYLDGKDTIGTPGGATANDVFSSIVLPAGFDGVENNFGEIKASSIAGNVYYDANNDGVFQGSELGIPGTTVTLTGTDDLGNPVSLSTTTDGNGAYAFGNLRPGTYMLTETQPAGYIDGKDTIGTPGGSTANDVFSNVILPAGYDGVENNFGELKVSSISGYVYYDANNDGTFQGSESPIPGTTVTLSGTDDLGNSVFASTTTSGLGFYIFGNLRPGSYTINESQPSGYLDGKDTIGTPGGTTGNDVFSDIALPAGFDGVNNNFGEILASSISGYVYYDANNDGTFQGSESPIPGTTVTLTGTDDLGNSVNVSTSTNGSGFYSFGGLRPGVYTLTETQPSGYIDGKDTIGTPGGTTGNDVFSGISLPAGFDGVNNNFGEIKVSSISGYVYYDANNDGTFQGTESPISGTTVKLTGTNDLGAAVSLTTTTNGSGFYSFGNLRPGTYVITETQPAGYIDGKDTIGTPGGTTGNDVFSNIVLPAGFNGVNNNFGEVKVSSLSGYVYYDLNNDGIFQGTESPIPGTTVKLTGTDDLGTPVSSTTTTDAAGFYIFSNLRPGTYAIAETQPAGYNDGKDTIGTPGGTTANDLFSGILLPAGFNGVNNNFGEIKSKGEIRGTKFLDVTGNGLTSDDTGFGGVTIYIDANNNGSLDAGERSTISGPDGTYVFNNLNPGTYIIREVVPAGYVRTFPVLADNYSVTLSTGQIVTGKDFANAESCGCCKESISSFYFVINGDKYVTDLRGNTNQGDEVTAYFTIKAGSQPETLTLVSYTAPGSSFDASVAYQQKIYDLSSGTFGPGTYSLTVIIPDCNYQVDFVCGEAIEQFGPAGSNIFYTPQNRLLSADNDGCNACIPDSSRITGNVYVDKDNDGKFDANEVGLQNVVVTLTGTDYTGKSVSITKKTYSDGSYSFGNLARGTYKVTEGQPSTFNDGKDTLGSLGGTKPSNDVLASIVLPANTIATDYNFGECLTSGTTVNSGDTATIGFWRGAYGQNLIKSLNGSANATNLGNWLASNFSNLFGSASGSSLAGKTNSQVASAFNTKFAATGIKLEAQLMATALSLYVTSSTLAGGSYAAAYGFTVTSAGSSGRMVNVGGAGSLLGVSNNSTISIFDLLKKANSKASSGSLYSADATARGSLNSLFDTVNQLGGIG